MEIIKFNEQRMNDLFPQGFLTKTSTLIRGSDCSRNLHKTQSRKKTEHLHLKIIEWI